MTSQELTLVLSVLLNITLLVYLFCRKSGNRDKDTIHSADKEASLTRTFDWKLDSARGTRLSGHLELEMSKQQVLEERRNNPYSSPSLTRDNKEYVRQMYHYMLVHPNCLSASAKIVQYINRLCSQKGISELDKLQFVLDFVQEPNIHYILDGKSEELSGAVQYIRYPDETLFDGHGDCDCKAFLTATLYHLMGYNVLYMMSRKLQHAAICIEYDTRWAARIGNQSKIQDVTVKINGQWYIYCETTSDGFRIGGIANSQSVSDFDTMLELKA